MDLADALLNAKKYIHEPKFASKEKMWSFEVYNEKGWTSCFFMSEEACWVEFYKRFRGIKESLMGIKKEKTK